MMHIATYGYQPTSDLIDHFDSVNGRRTRYEYEPHRNLKTLVENKFEIDNISNNISNYAYTYDDVGRRDTLTLTGTEFQKAANAKSATQWFTDAPVVQDSVEMIPETRGYAYDPIGNRKTATGWDETAQAPTANAYVPNSLNQYATVNAAALIYDLDGNLTEDAGKSYTYDGENRLLSITPKVPGEGDRKATFAYDYMGRRVKKESYAYQSSAWTKTDETRYLYDGWNMIRELDATGATKRSFVWGIDLSGTLQGAGGIGGLIASVDATTSAQYHYFNDGNGNVGQLVDYATGNAVAHYEYDPFGNVSYSHGTAAKLNPYRFSTKYHDDETNLDYYGYRYYAPTLGRWLNRDPIGERGGLNLYGFVGNSAISRMDPLGLKYGCSMDPSIDGNECLQNINDDKIIFYDNSECKCMDIDTDFNNMDAIQSPTSQNSCPSNDCSSGSYSFTGISYGGFLFFGGVTTMHLNFKCVGGTDTFNLTATSVNFGGGLGGGGSFPTGLAAGHNEEDVKQNVAGWGVFANLFPPEIPTEPSFGMGIDVGTQSVTGNSPMPVTVSSFNPGYGLEVSAGGSYTWILDKTCGCK